MLTLATLAAGAALAQAPPLTVLSSPALSFRIDQGQDINSFVRDHEVAAHLLLHGGRDPRALIAFPAGDSGVAIWFAGTSAPVQWKLLSTPLPVTAKDGAGRDLHGITAKVAADTNALDVRQALLSSVRVLRGYQSSGTVPKEVLVQSTQQGDLIQWERDRLDGAPGYRLSVRGIDGTTVAGESLHATTGHVLHFQLTALTGETPLTPIPAAALLTPGATGDQRSRDVLAFLSYREKYLAGSWRFDTYFGRDTLLSLAILAPVLDASAVASGIASVLDRLAPDGEIAHEEDIGEFAILDNLRAGRGRTSSPVYDYSMVDESFLLAPLVARWLRGDAERADARALVARRLLSGERAGDALIRNFAWIVRRTRPFAERPAVVSLIGLKPGRAAGEWRDSDAGLGGGYYPYDVNAVLVPAALASIDQILRTHALDPYLSPARRQLLARAHEQSEVWAQRVPRLFTITVPAQQAKAAVVSYAAAQGVDAKAAVASVTGDTLSFDALSLTRDGQPVHVMHSDGAFALFFETPEASEVERALRTVSRPFPAGLWTPVGILVADPVFADGDTQARFSNRAYHGTVIWSWQQALLVAGLDRQLARTDVAQGLRDSLLQARQLAWSAITASASFRTSELWSWSYADGCYRAVAFGQHGGDVDESNAAQLWSTVYLALPSPPLTSGSRTGPCTAVTAAATISSE